MEKAHTHVIVSTESTSETTSDADSAWVARVQAGDVAAFDHLVKKYRQRLFSIVYNLTSNREDAADLTQDSFIKAFRSIHHFKGTSSFFTWLYRIAVNTTLTHLKKNRFKHFFSFEAIDEEGASAEVIEKLTSKNQTDKPTLIKELQEKLNEALHKLSLTHRTVVILYEIEGLSHLEIAEITKTSEGTVRSRLHYAKQQLQSYLQDYIN